MKYEKLVSYRKNGGSFVYDDGNDGKKYVCRVEGCKKSYSSEGAL
jgi:hypothetical protein